jgi:CheY-like chemotaxis protein
MRIRVRLSVHNTGPTIPAEELPRLFESFRRGSGTEGTPGFGLGLAVCRRLAERMGGRMSAASAAGDTEFALELPLPMSAAPVGRDHAPTSVSRALAIEDEDYNRLALGHALRALGYEIDWATDGASALQLARRQAYDLILTDWKLPDIDGDELCRQLLAVLAPPRPPIVAVTAYSSAEKMAAARAAGMAGFVTKPITREKLEQLIRNLDTGPQPRHSLDLTRQPGAHPALALLGELAPTLQKLSADLATGWQQTEAQARLRDPRTSRAAHGLRSLLLLAGEADFAEQLGLLESAAAAADWDTVDRLLPFLAEEMGAVRTRLTAGG